MAPVCQRSLCGNTFDYVDSFFAIRFDTFCNADKPLMRTALLPVDGMHVTLGRSGSQSSKHCIDKAAIVERIHISSSTFYLCYILPQFYHSSVDTL